MTSTSPLSGFVVVELGHNVAGPVGGQILAELGAKVVKVEDPGKGDAARHWPPVVDGISTVYPRPESFKGRCHGGFQRCNPIGRPESAHPE